MRGNPPYLEYLFLVCEQTRQKVNERFYPVPDPSSDDLGLFGGGIRQLPSGKDQGKYSVESVDALVGVPSVSGLACQIQELDQWIERCICGHGRLELFLEVIDGYCCL